MHHRLFPPLIRSAWERPVVGSAEKTFTQRLKHCRSTCRAWARRLTPIKTREHEIKLLINALDLLEEQRALHPNEASLRRAAIQGLQDLYSEKLAFWRQCFHVRLALEWDENSRFFHAATSGRRRHNAIAYLEHEGIATSAHDAKSTILHSFYSDLLGRARETTWDFSLGDLYPHFTIDMDDLSEPFTMTEITQALFAMDVHASPGPDGFGPAFYRHFWSSLRHDVLHLFHAFHEGCLELDGLNRALLILLPKKEGVRTPDGFRPISLQNCPMKLFSKVMVNHLKPHIPTLVDSDQTGFVHGRTIAKNFVYAAGLLSCCHKRKVPTAVLKLDFKKAFDSVEWPSLDRILHGRSFQFSLESLGFSHFKQWKNHGSSEQSAG